MRWTTLLFLSVLFAFPAWGVEDRPQYAKDIVRTVHRVRTAIEKNESVLAEDLALIKAQVELITQNRETLSLFSQYLYGRGLLYLDDLFDDLTYLHQGMADPATSDDFRSRLNALSFPALAQRLESVTMEGLPDNLEWGEPVQGAFDRIGRFEKASAETLAAQDSFHEAGRVAAVKLHHRQSAIVLLLSGVAVYATWHILGIDQMSPREFVGFLFSVWAANQAVYWTIWEKFQWIEPFKKWAANEEFLVLKETWKRLLKLSPALSAQKARSAASSKLVSTAKQADAQADAALVGMFESLDDEDTSNDPAIKGELFETFLSELEGGNGRRAMQILKKLRETDPTSKAARMSEAVARIFKLRAKMEFRCLVRQAMQASWRLVVLGILVYGSNEGIRALLPEDLARWRTVPNSILAGLGLRRIVSVIWLPHRVEALRRQSNREEEELRKAFDDLIAIDPSGDTVERIAEYDSGVAAHQLVTYAAGDALAANPNGQRTRKLWNLVNRELSTSHPSGSRVQDLLEDTFRAQRSCIARLLGAVKNLSGVFRVVDNVVVEP
jgi:hypothetical protein